MLYENGLDKADDLFTDPTACINGSKRRDDMEMTFTWIGGATWILKIQNVLRIACDPVLCPAGTIQYYGFFSSTRLNEPVFTPTLPSNMPNPVDTKQTIIYRIMGLFKGVFKKRPNSLFTAFFANQLNPMKMSKKSSNRSVTPLPRVAPPVSAILNSGLRSMEKIKM